jgi:2'-hydroxyisoflavone reductase
MALLILGGTGFLGRHLAEAALADGHRVTLFNRGLSAPGLFPEVENIKGDREADLSALLGRRWDAVIDTCGYVPRVVRASAALLADAVDHYTFVSSISVYSDAIEPGADEEALV